MAYPDPYAVTYSYTGFAAGLGDGSFPGTQVDIDFAALSASLADTIAFLQGITRSDGALANGIVTFDSLNTALKAVLGDAEALQDLTALAAAAHADAVAAASSATSADASKNTAVASYDSFDDRYLGAKSGNPSLDNDGNALIDGALYWNTSVPEMRVRSGAAWVVLSGGIPTGYLDADGLFAADSDTKVATQRATNTRIKTLLATWPAFSAHKNGTNQTGVVANANTAVTFGTEKFDTGGFYDPTTSRWTPPAGIASLSVHITQQVTNAVAGDVMQLIITKNGATIALTRAIISATAVTHNVSISITEPCNGTDYFAVVAAFGATGGDRIIAGGATVTWFNGRMVSVS